MNKIINTNKCPKCGYSSGIALEECPKCGVIIKKFIKTKNSEEKQKKWKG
jgi:rubrerythrin